jgi:hypothetical protein
MKIFKNLTFAALALAATLLFQTSITRADDRGQRGGDNERGDREHRDVKSTFTKWVVDVPNLPGLIINMAGVVGGDVGDGIFTGEVLSRVVDPMAGVTKIVAFYHFTGLKHSFTALVHVEARGSTPGSTAVIIGVVTDGWLEGHAVKGEYTVITCDHVGPSPNCFQGTLEIDRDSND